AAAGSGTPRNRRRRRHSDPAHEDRRGLPVHTSGGPPRTDDRRRPRSAHGCGQQRPLPVPREPVRRIVRVQVLIRGASPLGLPYTLSRAPLRRRARFAWLTRCARSLLRHWPQALPHRLVFGGPFHGGPPPPRKRST